MVENNKVHTFYYPHEIDSAVRGEWSNEVTYNILGDLWECYQNLMKINNDYDSIYQEGFDAGEIEGDHNADDRYDEGFDDGEKEGFGEGYDEGYEDGKAGIEPKY